MGLEMDGAMQQAAQAGRHTPGVEAGIPGMAGMAGMAGIIPAWRRGRPAACVALQHEIPKPFKIKTLRCCGGGAETPRSARAHVVSPGI
jgi:hypothetical protein